MRRSRPRPPADPVALARAVGLVRVAIGVGLVVAPSLWSRLLGGVPPRQDAVAAARIAGARDLGMGLGAVLAAREGATPELRRWVGASALADAVDAFAVARSDTFRALPRWAAVGAGTTATALGLLARRHLPES